MTNGVDEDNDYDLTAMIMMIISRDALFDPMATDTDMWQMMTMVTTKTMMMRMMMPMTVKIMRMVVLVNMTQIRFEEVGLMRSMAKDSWRLHPEV